MENEKGKIKLAILSFSILLMGIIGIAGGLSVIGKHFSNLPQTSIQLLISLPCILIIVFSFLAGKLQEYVSKKTLVIIGILCFIVGGTLPAFISSFTVILVLRAILGVGIGITQPLSSALVVEYFEGDECSKVMGQQTAAQMLGCAVMVLLGGYLAVIGWQTIFYLHLIGIISLIIVLICLPHDKPARNAAAEGAPAGKVNLSGVYGWVITMFLFFISGQIFSVFISFLVESQKLGTPAQAGQTLMFFALGGFLMGLVFGKVATSAKNFTLSIGLFLLGISYLMMAYAPNIAVVYAGSLVCGFAFSIVMPCVIVGASQSVDAFSAPMAISVVLCAQNLAQFVSPYIATPIAAAMGGDVNKSAYLFAAALGIVMAVWAVFWGIAKDRKQQHLAA
ncbi:putative niacin/nicotinamide transporter NaiP [Pelotomaculum schinkii]|uniref:Putative niacin/nicotinamide transporter NaiP n=1 Tax=Pelotomaculum schinkii TaxID=78350 RepID=A0A4Y7RA93_9FIRM|nr:MFS transporter [Pelotomaculum schinkii]TEB05712.1 putative niacin/nicotinamide transporter NaiP [Pelotomaculum schinkii]